MRGATGRAATPTAHQPQSRVKQVVVGVSSMLMAEPPAQGAPTRRPSRTLRTPRVPPPRAARARGRHPSHQFKLPTPPAPPPQPVVACEDGHPLGSPRATKPQPAARARSGSMRARAVSRAALLVAGLCALGCAAGDPGDLGGLRPPGFRPPSIFSAEWAGGCRAGYGRPRGPGPARGQDTFYLPVERTAWGRRPWQPSPARRARANSGACAAAARAQPLHHWRTAWCRRNTRLRLTPRRPAPHHALRQRGGRRAPAPAAPARPGRARQCDGRVDQA